MDFVFDIIYNIIIQYIYPGTPGHQCDRTVAPTTYGTVHVALGESESYIAHVGAIRY
jgi:hypothetical protein